MKSVVLGCSIFCFLFITTSFSYTQWQTTKGRRYVGDCQLETNNITITTYPYHVDVVEEAVIGTRGNVYSGDPNTLEITGQFNLSPGSSLRSLLLWNGDQILKAKLIDKKKADKIMDSIVNYTYRDPALVKYEGGNRYSYRIYPVKINQSRKIRILYTIPIQSQRGILEHSIQTAFTLGCRYIPSQIQVTFENSDTTSKKFVLQHGMSKKTVQFGTKYLIPHKEFNTRNYKYRYPSPAPLRIYPKWINPNKAYSYSLESSKAMGVYTAIFLTIPDTLKKFVLDSNLIDPTLEAKIQMNDNSYVLNIPKKVDTGNISMYIKSKTPWDGNIFWNIYNKEGISAATYVQSLVQNTETDKNRILPFIWATKYSLAEGHGDLGCIFGFIDNRMSLLALERDSLPLEEARKWYDRGVPPLLPSEIVTDTSKIGIPNEKIIIDIGNISTDIDPFCKTALDQLAITVKADNIILIKFGTLTPKNVTITVYDMRGKQIIRFNKLKIRGNGTKVILPKSLKGLYVMNIRIGDRKISRKFLLK
ncbi:MAG: T9SS type A sorting domain-containing protein [Chitinispirillia bacterium]|jgi:hypothetical protein